MTKSTIKRRQTYRLMKMFGMNVEKEKEKARLKLKRKAERRHVKKVFKETPQLNKVKRIKMVLFPKPVLPKLADDPDKLAKKKQKQQQKLEKKKLKKKKVGERKKAAAAAQPAKE